VLATKVYFMMGDGPGRGPACPRRAIMEQVRRLPGPAWARTYVDLYQIHRFRPRRPPAEETIGSAARTWVRGGGRAPVHRRFRRCGAWQFSKTAVHRAAARMGRSSCRCRTSTASCSARMRREMFGPPRRPGNRQHPVGARWPRAGWPGPVGRAGPPAARPTTSPAGSCPHDDKPIRGRGAGPWRNETWACPWPRSPLAWVLRNPVVSAAHRRPPPGQGHLADARRPRSTSDWTDDEAAAASRPRTRRGRQHRLSSRGRSVRCPAMSPGGGRPIEGPAG